MEASKKEIDENLKCASFANVCEPPGPHCEFANEILGRLRKQNGYFLRDHQSANVVVELHDLLDAGQWQVGASILSPNVMVYKI